MAPTFSGGSASRPYPEFAPDGDNFLAPTNTIKTRNILGHPRSMIFISFEIAHATSY